jgi:hypothetical protein
MENQMSAWENGSNKMTYPIRSHICQVLVEDIPDVIDVQPTATLTFLQRAQERRICQQDILDVREYHHDRLALQKPQHARIEYLYMSPITRANPI